MRKDWKARIAHIRGEMAGPWPRLFLWTYLSNNRGGCKIWSAASDGVTFKKKSNCFQEAKGFVDGVGSPPKELVLTGTRIAPLISSHPVPRRLCRWLSNVLCSSGSHFSSVTLEPGTGPVHGCAVVLELLLEKKQRSWDQQHAEAFPLEPGICSSLPAHLF